MLAKIQ
jgi:hypothetical protein